MLRNILIGMGITLLVVATTAEIKFPPRPAVLYNPSASAPIGWYRLRDNSPLKVGDQVAAYAPEWARKLADERQYLPYEYPMIKTIWASSGTQICTENNRTHVPNYPVIIRLSQDSLGRDMPKLSGCFTLKPDEYFLVSPDVQTKRRGVSVSEQPGFINGFDSRYFGAVEAKNILGKVEFLGNRELSRGGEKRENRVVFGGLREGKIKDPAHLGLSHCLHIVFSGPPNFGRAHLIGAMPLASVVFSLPTSKKRTNTVVLRKGG